MEREGQRAGRGLSGIPVDRKTSKAAMLSSAGKEKNANHPSSPGSSAELAPAAQ